MNGANRPPEVGTGTLLLAGLIGFLLVWAVIGFVQVVTR